MAKQTKSNIANSQQLNFFCPLPSGMQSEFAGGRGVEVASLVHFVCMIVFHPFPAASS